MSNSFSAEAIVRADAHVTNMVAKVEAVVPNPPKAEASAGTLVHSSKSYDGAYEAVPKPRKQTFQTKNKTMKDDFVVTEIMLHEAPNVFGTTITIGD